MSSALAEFSTAEKWLRQRVGQVPKTALGWFRAGVGFYNKRHFEFAIECLQTSVRLDPMNYNAYQILARACIAVNRREEAIAALKESVKLDNPSDWQLLIELTSAQSPAGRT
eukprot:TRINITY_DN4532_c0_g3_i1.p1 TRINITY_DN4532_c0_g3~~TRINITY_DN4532_c0_g3_i1.p1  ORF type:complete len:112 (+),score=15.85 TRINITY_DN4532_c0_g3_i1:72-407(+)